MELTPRQREILSRIASIVAGLVLCYWAWGCVQWGLGSLNDDATQGALHNVPNARAARGAVALFLLLLVPFGIGLVFGVLGIGLIGIALYRRPKATLTKARRR